jgi:glutamyl-tRNA reductase
MAPLIAALRERADQLVAAELERARPKIDRLGDDGDVVAEVARRVMAKLLHEPTVQLKDAAGTARGERLGEALRSLFDL